MTPQEMNKAMQEAKSGILAEIRPFIAELRQEFVGAKITYIEDANGNVIWDKRGGGNE